MSMCFLADLLKMTSQASLGSRVILGTIPLACRAKNSWVYPRAFLAAGDRKMQRAMKKHHRLIRMVVQHNTSFAGMPLPCTSLLA